MSKFKKPLIILVALICLLICGAWKTTSVRYEYVSLIDSYSDINVFYTSRNVNADNQTKNGVPKYETFGNLTNACGAVAGAIAIGFYDKFYPDLIQGYESYFSSSGRYKAQDNIYIPSIINKLYSLMRTNIDGPGVTESEFQNGLKTYINNNGHSIEFQNININNNFDETAYKNAINSNKIVALLVQPGYLFNIGLGVGCDSINEIYISGNHIMIAYGYYNVSYYNGNSLIRTDNYIRVATGQPGVSIALYKIVPSQLDAAYILNII